MANPVRIVNNVIIEMTDEEVAEQAAFHDLVDQDLTGMRAERNGYLLGTDRTQIGDFALGSHTIEEWQTYRQALRDLLATSGLRNSNVVWPKSPVIVAVGQAAYDAEVAKEGKGPSAGEVARSAAESNAGYPGPGI